MKIIAVSGGVDSMCLLHKFKDEEIVVAHVNYGLRENSILETKLVQNYCKENHIQFECRFAPKFEKGNFQEEARIYRYQFFYELGQKYKCRQVLTAHHMDDLIETYFMQLERKSIPQYYGIQEKVEILGMEIMRPLLCLSKEELYEYAIQNKIPYLEDESNKSLKYTRNRIRDHLKQINRKDKLKILEEIKNKNNKKEDKYAFLRDLLFQNGLYHFSDLQLSEIEKCMKVGKKPYRLSENLYLYPNYCVYPKFVEYEYHFDKIESFQCDYFKFGPSEKNGFYLSKDDFPIIIRNWKQGDKIKKHYGTKKISRFFKDNKIDLYSRISWPIVLNRYGEIIFVVGLGASSDYISDKVNSFVVK